MAISAIATSTLISFVIHAPWASPNVYNDITGSFWGRCWVQTGSLPYIPTNTSCDYAFEYPAISGLILYVARFFGSDLTSFYNAVSAMTLAAAVVVAGGTWGISRRLGKSLDPLYFLMPSFIIYGIYNFDMFHAAFVVLSVLSFLSGKRTLSAVFLGLGVDTKLTSVVLLPVFLMEIHSGDKDLGLWKKRAFRVLGINGRRLWYFAVFALVVAAVNLPFLFLNYSNFVQGYTFVANFGLEDAWFVWIFQNPNTWGFARIFGLGVSGLLLLRIYTLHVSLVPKSALAIAAYLLGTYIYSPQLNLVLIPLLAAMDLRHPTLYPWDGFNALIILTWFVSPSFVLGGVCPNADLTCPTLAGTWPQLFALLRAGSLALVCVGIASREGHSITGWVKSLMGRSADPMAAGAPPSSSP
jgi:hypothetical protein